MSDDVEARVHAIESRLRRGHTNRHDEAYILHQLSEAPTGVLSAVLERLSLSRLFGEVDDRRFLGPDRLSALYALLCVERLDELPVPVRARIVDGASRGRTGSADERAIRDVFLGTRGEALSELKNAIDTGDDHHDLQQLVYGDIDDDDVRSEILDHIQAEAASVPRREVKVLSDIDDTFYCNWKDERFPKKTVYPGVRQLYIELDRGPHIEPGRMGDIAFVTARPRDRPGFVERLTHQTLRELGVADPTVLAGSFRALHSNEAIAKRKLRNFREYAALFPEYGFVFVGDSGQGDAGFGAAMREHDPERVRAILIHDVVDTPTETRRSWAARGVTFFDTYVGAGIEAHALGLIETRGVVRIAEAALDELAQIAFDDEGACAPRRAELERDVARARAI
jgi:hypothetical protein